MQDWSRVGSGGWMGRAFHKLLWPFTADISSTFSLTKMPAILILQNSRNSLEMETNQYHVLLQADIPSIEIVVMSGQLFWAVHVVCRYNIRLPNRYSIPSTHMGRDCQTTEERIMGLLKAFFGKCSIPLTPGNLWPISIQSGEGAFKMVLWTPKPYFRKTKRHSGKWELPQNDPPTAPSAPPAPTMDGSAVHALALLATSIPLHWIGWVSYPWSCGMV